MTGVETLSDLLKTLDPDGKPAAMIEILGQSNEVLEDLVISEGNLPTGHQFTIETELPEPVVRRYNQGVAPTKGTAAQVVESCVIFEDRSSVDKALADIYGDKINTYRLQRGRRHIEGFNQKVAKQLFYGATAEEILGLATRYNSLTDVNKDNVIDAGGAGSDNTSVFLVGWGVDKCWAIYPKGSKAGLYHEDLGVGDEFDANNNRYRAYMDRWEWRIGLAVADWRCVVRIANIDVSDMNSLTGTQAPTAATFLPKLLAKAIDRIPQGVTNMAFYANRTVLSNLRIMAMEKATNVLSIEQGLNQFGKPRGTLTFLGYPIRRVDQILNTESAVS